MAFVLSLRGQGSAQAAEFLRQGGTIGVSRRWCASYKPLITPK
jgi:hypothetical protein